MGAGPGYVLLVSSCFERPCSAHQLPKVRWPPSPLGTGLDFPERHSTWATPTDSPGRALQSLLLRVLGKPWGFYPLSPKSQEIAAPGQSRNFYPKTLREGNS